jgi:mannose/fructose-specific phosphotransferase system component IIA
MSDPAGSPLRGVVAAHGSLAAALIGAAEEITGIHGALVPVSNTNCDRGSLEERIASAVGDGAAVVFVDMASGSCLTAALHRLHAREGVSVVTGVNLAMLIDFLFHRDLPAAEAAKRALAVGERAIRTPS